MVAYIIIVRVAWWHGAGGTVLPVVAAGFEFQGVRTRPMNPKRLSSVLLCTHHLRGLTGVDECFIFWDECFNFLHGLFPYIRNPSTSTHESFQVSWQLVIFYHAT